MEWFPQLTPGAVAQFPAAKRAIQRTVVNEMRDGRAVKLSDPDGYGSLWRLELRGLTDAERDAVLALFQACEGRRGTFGFLDPFGNLIKWSEDLNGQAWEKGSEIWLTPGVADPFGGTLATRIANTGSVVESLEQPLQAPAWYRYSLSVWARSAGETELTLYGRTAASTGSAPFRIGTSWERLVHSFELTGPEETVTAGVSLAAGANVEVFGFQLEAQAGASKYKRTTARSGVQLNACFDADSLVLTTDAPGRHSYSLLVRAHE